MVRSARVWPIVGIGYRHYRTGTIYFVEAVGSWEPDIRRVMVAYRSREEIEANAPSWFRDLSDFDSKLRVGSRLVSRFERTEAVLPEGPQVPHLMQLARCIIGELPVKRTAMPVEMVNHVKAFAALLAVDHARGLATVGYIHEATGLSQATTSVTMALLRALKLVTGSTPEDARETTLALTPQGAQARQFTRRHKRQTGGSNGSEEGEAFEQEDHEDERDRT
jgi:DNA-binding MarR family transcriptional regulator